MRRKVWTGLTAAASALAILSTSAFTDPDPTVTNVHPATAPGGGSGLVVAVISDGFTSADSHNFTKAVEILLLNQLLKDPFYVPYESRFTIETVLTEQTTTTGSMFGFKQGTGVPCDIDWNDNGVDTTALVDTFAAKWIAPKHSDYIVVIGNDDSGRRGCFHDDWTYFPSGARFENLGRPQHEFGHLIGGLFDEYDFSVAPFNGPYQGPPGPPVDTKNCSTAETPYWHTSPQMIGISATPTDPTGCNHYQLGIRRPYADCRMNVDTDLPFCQVCGRVMTYALESSSPAAPTNLRIRARVLSQARQQPRPPPPPPLTSSVRVLVRVPRDGGAAKVVTVAEVRDVYAPHQKRLGDLAYEIVDNGRIVDTGVFPGEPFETRGEGSAKLSRAAKSENAAAVVVYIPGVTIANLQSPSRKVSINFYRLKPVSGFGQEVTPAVLATLKSDATSAGSLSSSDLKSFLASMPKRSR